MSSTATNCLQSTALAAANTKVSEKPGLLSPSWRYSGGEKNIKYQWFFFLKKNLMAPIQETRAKYQGKGVRGSRRSLRFEERIGIEQEKKKGRRTCQTKTKARTGTWVRCSRRSSWMQEREGKKGIHMMSLPSGNAITN